MLLSTCNRVEMYVLLAFDNEIPPLIDIFGIVIEKLSEILQLSKSECEQVLYMYDGRKWHHLLGFLSSLANAWSIRGLFWTSATVFQL